MAKYSIGVVGVWGCVGVWTGTVMDEAHWVGSEKDGPWAEMGVWMVGLMRGCEGWAWVDTTDKCCSCGCLWTLYSDGLCCCITGGCTNMP